MSSLYEKLQQEMESILLKTMPDVQSVYNEQGEEAAYEVIYLIADGIKNQLLENDVNENFAEEIKENYIQDMTQAVIVNKH